MLDKTRANIFSCKANHLFIPVNCVGVMGAGLAEAAANRWPGVKKIHEYACHAGKLRQIGDYFTVETPMKVLSIPVKAVLFATKVDWREKSDLGGIERGLIEWRRRFEPRRTASFDAWGGLRCGDSTPWVWAWRSRQRGIGGGVTPGFRRVRVPYPVSGGDCRG